MTQTLEPTTAQAEAPRRRGRSPRRPIAERTANFNFRIPLGLDDQLRDYAERTGVTMTDVILAALTSYLDERKA